MLEGVRPIRRGAGRSFCERHPRRRKSRPRLRRRRLRLSKHRILTATRPPRNLAAPAQASGRRPRFGAGEDAAKANVWRILADLPAGSRPSPPVSTNYIRTTYITISLTFLSLKLIVAHSAHHGPDLRLPLRTTSHSCEGRNKGHGHEIRGALALPQSSVWLYCSGRIQRRSRGIKSTMHLRQRHEEGVFPACLSLL